MTSDTYCVYRTVCLATGACYVGQTGNLSRRSKAHFSMLKNNTHCSSELQQLYNQFGEYGFQVETLENVNKQQRRYRENFYISLLNAINPPSIGFSNPVIWNGVQYRSINQAAKHEGWSPRALAKYLKR